MSDKMEVDPSTWHDETSTEDVLTYVYTPLGAQSKVKKHTTKLAELYAVNVQALRDLKLKDWEKLDFPSPLERAILRAIAKAPAPASQVEEPTIASQLHLIDALKHLGIFPSLNSHGSLSDAEYYAGIKEKIEQIQPWMDSEHELPSTLLSNFNLSPPEADLEAPYQKHFFEELKKLKRTAVKKEKRPSSDVLNHLLPVDTHANFYLDGRAPDLSFHYSANPFSAMNIATLGEIKPKRKNGFTGSDIGELLTNAERALKVQPFRTEITVFLTDCHVIQFFQVAKKDETRRYYKSQLFGVKGGLVPEEGARLLAHLLWAEQKDLYSSLPPSPDFGQFKVTLTKFLGIGATSHVYLGTVRGKQNTDNWAVKIFNAKHASNLGPEVDILNSLASGKVQNVPIIKDKSQQMLLLAPVAIHFHQNLRLVHVQQAAATLQSVHRLGVAHRDIRPENIMRVSEGEVLVNDWGFAASLYTPTLYKGTLHYASDNILKGLQNGSQNHTPCPEDDLQSLIRTIYALSFPSAVVDLHQISNPIQILDFWELKLKGDCWTRMCAAASARQYDALVSLASFLPV